jgi:glycosyltransferase involved in cell wall biosynthesis
MTECHVLSQYPVSRAFAHEIAEQMGVTPQFTNLTGSRAGTLRSLWKLLRAIRARSVVVALEDDESAAITPILQMLASVTGGERLMTLIPGAEPRSFSRAAALTSVLELVTRSVLAGALLLAVSVRLSRLRRVARIKGVKLGSRRVLYVNANLWFGLKAGGSIGHISGVVNALSGRGYQVTFASAGGRLMVDERAEYAKLPPLKGFAFPPEVNCYVYARGVEKTVRPIASSGIAFIYQRLSVGNITGVDVSRSTQVPLVCEYNGSDAWTGKHWGRPLKFHRLAVLAEEVMLHHAHVVVTVSEVLRDELVGRGVDPARIVTYPNCIDPNLFDPSRFDQLAVAALRARYGIPTDALVATFVGTFGQWHGVDVLAEAIRVMMEKHSDWLKHARVRFLLVGDGAKMPRVREMLDHPLRDRFVVIAGLVPQPEAPLHLAASDILLSPHVKNPDGTRFFGSPTKLFEYMAMGKPIIASDLDQIGNVLQDSLRVAELPSGDPPSGDTKLALLTRPGAADDLVAALQFLVERAEWRESLGKNVRRAALERYTWDRHVGEIVLGLKRALALDSQSGRTARGC